MIPVIAPFLSLFKKIAPKKEGANWAITTNATKPIETSE
jgi:hypothetical protein